MAKKKQKKQKTNKQRTAIKHSQERYQNWFSKVTYEHCSDIDNQWAVGPSPAQDPAL